MCVCCDDDMELLLDVLQHVHLGLILGQSSGVRSSTVQLDSVSSTPTPHAFTQLSQLILGINKSQLLLHVYIMCVFRICTIFISTISRILYSLLKCMLFLIYSVLKRYFPTNVQVFFFFLQARKSHSITWNNNLFFIFVKKLHTKFIQIPQISRNISQIKSKSSQCT